MDDFSIIGDSFEDYLAHLTAVLKRCKEMNLVLNWVKCNFMAKKGIALGHKILEKGIEVNQAEFEVISKLHPLRTEKGVRSFLGHVGFY